jgi:hypothetical protein
MPRVGPTESDLENRFYECLRQAGRGLTYGRLVTEYSRRYALTDRSAKTHLKVLRAGMDAGRVKEVGRYRGPEGWLYGCIDKEPFANAKEAAELPAIEPPPSTVGLGGVFQDSPIRSEWTNCPVTNRIVRTTVITMGVADFMECPICSRAHFLGVNPKMKDQRLYAWQVDPLANAEEYADAITSSFIGDPKTFKPQKPTIERVRRGGHFVGLWFRTSWETDPEEDLRKRGLLRPGTGQVVLPKDVDLERDRLLRKARRPSNRRRDPRERRPAPLR